LERKLASGPKNLEKNAKTTVINAVTNAVIELMVVMTAEEVAMKEESKKGINQVKIGIVLNAEIVIIHSVKTVTVVKHLDLVQVAQALAAMRDMVAVMTAEVVTVVVMTAEAVTVVVMTAEAVMVAVILIVHQTEMAQITVMTGIVQSAKIAISLSVQNVIAVV
jgi:hypothetical protein